MQQPPQARDLLGYAGSPPHPHWPGGGAGSGVDRRQFRGGSGVTDGDTQNEAVYEIEQPVIGQPNPAIDSRFEYASRAQRTRAGGSAEERTAEGPVIFPMKLRTPLKLSERNFKPAI